MKQEDRWTVVALVASLVLVIVANLYVPSPWSNRDEIRALERRVRRLEVDLNRD